MGYPSIEIRQNEYPGVTSVPNEFIDRYMAKAPGEYVKVYLYLLRCLNDKEAVFSFAHAALLLDSSEGDVRRALFYWENEELLTLECSGSTITGISLCSADAFPREDEESPVSGNVPEYSAAKLRAFTADPEIRQMIFVAEQYLGHRLRRQDLCCFCFWHKELHFSTDLMIELVDLCVSDGLHEISQLHAYAQEWHAAGICSAADARAYMKTRKEASQQAAAQEALSEKVCTAMGITGRTLNDAERSRIRKWSREWDFTDEMICEACRRTIANTHQASFEYADTVLRNWHAAHVTDPDGIRAEDEAFRSRKIAEKQPRGKAAAGGRESRRGKYGELELLTMANI